MLVFILWNLAKTGSVIVLELFTKRSVRYLIKG